MTDKASYPVATLDDIGRIPAEALPRFLAELPAILRAREEVRAAIPALAEQMKANAPWPWRLLPLPFFAATLERQIMNRGNWIDDDKGTVTVTMAVKSGDDPFFKRTERMS